MNRKLGKKNDDMKVEYQQFFDKAKEDTGTWVVCTEEFVATLTRQ